MNAKTLLMLGGAAVALYVVYALFLSPGTQSGTASLGGSGGGSPLPDLTGLEAQSKGAGSTKPALAHK